jgi:hypothetical protein
MNRSFDRIVPPVECLEGMPGAKSGGRLHQSDFNEQRFLFRLFHAAMR